MPSSPTGGTMLASGFFDTAGTGQSITVNAGSGYDYLILGISTPSSAGSSVDLVDNLSLKAGSGGGETSAGDDSGLAVDEGSSGNTLDVLANDSGTGIEITSVTSPSYGSVTNNINDLEYTPDAGVWGVSDSFDYTITADDSSTATATVTVSIDATDGSTTIPTDDLPVALDFGLGYSANRVLDSNSHWQLASDGTGFDTSGSSDSTYMLADDTVSGDFQAYVQLVSLSGPSGSRMGLMLRDGDSDGAEFIAIGSADADGYKLQQRTGTGGADAETDTTAGDTHSFTNGKWVLLQRVGDTVTVAVDEDNTGDYTQETTVDISGWSDTLHVGLYVHSGQAGTNAVAEFDGYTIVNLAPGSGLLSESFDGSTTVGTGTGNDWVVVDEGTNGGASSWSISSGELTQTSNHYGGSTSSNVNTAKDRVGTYAYWSDSAASSWSEYTVTADVRSGDDDGIGIMFYLDQANDDYYRFEMDTQRSFWTLVKVVGGTHTLLASDGADAYTEGNDYRLTISMDASANIIVTREDLTAGTAAVELANVTDSSSPLTEGTIALYSWGNTDANFDDVSVTGAGPDALDLNAQSGGLSAYGTEHNQDDSATSGTISTDGTTVTFTGNDWESIELAQSVTLTASTVLEFTFSSTQKGEFHGIALDDDSEWSDEKRGVSIYGSQHDSQASSGLNSETTYGGSGEETYTLTLADYPGYGAGQVMTHLCFINDGDNGNTGESVFKNIKIYEP
jgi:hypothetical protein